MLNLTRRPSKMTRRESELAPGPHFSPGSGRVVPQSELLPTPGSPTSSTRGLYSRPVSRAIALFSAQVHATTSSWPYSDPMMYCRHGVSSIRHGSPGGALCMACPH